MELRNGGNYVGQLQEYCMQSPWVGLPQYDDLGSTGNSNTPTFKMACRVGGARVVGELNGKKAALKQSLAFDMLQFLHNNNSSQSPHLRKLNSTDWEDWDSPALNKMEIFPIKSVIPAFPTASGPLLQESNRPIPKHEPPCLESHFCPDISDLTGMSVTANYADMLIDLCRQKKLEPPTFKVLNKSGPSHNPKFRMECLVPGFSVQLEMESNQKYITKCLNYLMLNKLQKENAAAVVTGIELGSCLGSPPKKAKWGHESKIALQFARTLSFEGTDAERSRGGTAVPLREVEQIAMEAWPNNPPGDALEDGSGEFDLFKGMSPTKNYAGDLNNYCQKNNLIYSCREILRSGPPNRPTFVVQAAVVRKNDPAKVLHSEELKMEKNIKTIKRYLDFLMCKKLGLETGCAAPTETLDGDLNNAEGEEDGDGEAQLEELRLVRETINIHMPKSKSPTIARRIPHEKKHFCKGRFVYTALSHLRNGTAGGKSSRQILNDIIQDEKRHGTASVRDFCISRKPPFQCMLSMKFHDSSFTFPGTGPSRPEALEDAATKALTFLDKMLMPNS